MHGSTACCIGIGTNRRESGSAHPIDEAREGDDVNRLPEFRTYCLKPGTLHAFHQVMRQRAVPMIRADGMDEERYCLVRAYADCQALETEQAAFYRATEWREGPRQALVVHIDTSLNTLLWMADDAVERLRTLNPSRRSVARDCMTANPGRVTAGPGSPFPAYPRRNGRNPARTSRANNSGSSHAAKCPPLSTSLK